MTPQEPAVEPAQSPPQAQEATPDAPQPQEAPVPAVDQSEDAQTESAEPEQPAQTWQASEYLHHAKGVGWYAILFLVLIVLCAAAAWFHQWLAIAVFVMAFVAIVVYGSKAPRTLNYSLDSKGLMIEAKSYPFNQFRSFGVVDDVAWQAIDLEPTKRFMPRLTILVDKDNKDQIIDRFAAELPRQDHAPDAVERATRYLRF